MQISVNFNTLCELPYKMHVYLMDLDNRIVEVNTQQLRFLSDFLNVPNLKLSDIKNETLQAIFEADKSQADTFCNENEAVLNNQQPFSFESPILIPNKKQIDLKTTKMPAFDAGGKLLGTIGFSYYVRELALDKINQYQLSKREIECLDSLKRGQTAKQTAKTLDLSPRTVEDYFDHIKHKLNCQNKLELIEKINREQLIIHYM